MLQNINNPSDDSDELLTEDMITQWKNNSIGSLIEAKNFSPQQLTALLNISEIQEKFSKRLPQARLHALAQNNKAYCEAILASDLSEKNPTIKSMAETTLKITHHRCHSQRTMSPR